MDVANQFVRHYYNLFDTDRTQLQGLYTNESKLTFEGQESLGPEAICTKLVSLPFKTVAHHITTVDCQITIDNKLLIAVLGQLKTDDDPPHSFFQTFSLADRNGSLVIMNDIFRLVIHHVA